MFSSFSNKLVWLWTTTKSVKHLNILFSPENASTAWVDRFFVVFFLRWEKICDHAGFCTFLNWDCTNTFYLKDPFCSQLLILFVWEKHIGNGICVKKVGHTDKSFYFHLFLPQGYWRFPSLPWDFLHYYTTISSAHQDHCGRCRIRTRGGIISVEWSLFVLLYNTNFMNKLKFYVFFY